MKRVREKLYKILSGEVQVNLNIKFMLIVFGVAFVHICLVFIFIYLKVIFLVVFNIISVIVYLFMYFSVEKESYLFVFNVSYFEVILHTFVTCFFIGWNFGFYMYVLALVPVSFYVAFSLKRVRNKIIFPCIYTILSLVVFTINKIWTVKHTPVYFVGTQFDRTTIYIFNTVVAYVMLLAFSMIYVLEIQNANRLLQNKNEELNIMAKYDSLTGLYNRREMTNIMREAEQSGKLFSLILCDIDDFKKFNDTYGHDCGDYTLIHVSEIILEVVTKSNIAARWGGEEMLLLIYGSIREGIQLAETLRKRIEEAEFIYNGQKMQVTITVGIADYQPNNKLDDVIIAADNCMYIGKNRGKNCVIIQEN